MTDLVPDREYQMTRFNAGEYKMVGAILLREMYRHPSVTREQKRKIYAELMERRRIVRDSASCSWMDDMISTE